MTAAPQGMGFCCAECSAPITRGARCEHCAAAFVHGIARSEIRKACSDLLKALPPWDWARIDDPLFGQRVSKRIGAAAQAWSIERGNLLILAPSGAGKTTAMVALVHRLFVEALDARDNAHPITKAYWITGYQLAAARREHRLGTQAPPEIRRAQSCQLLLLDDIGGEDAPPSLLMEVQQSRYEKSLPTITSSGMRREQLEARYGVACVRRMIEPVGTVLADWPAPRAPR